MLGPVVGRVELLGPVVGLVELLGPVVGRVELLGAVVYNDDVYFRSSNGTVCLSRHVCTRIDWMMM